VRWWMKELYRQRMQYGNTLMRDMTIELVEDSVKNFTRMSLPDFEHISSLIEPSIITDNTSGITCSYQNQLCETS
jgi:hypothetical protein